ncbi:MAG: hypothetical protein OQK54_05535 [Gammaproteobacteria bacterium]|nr:hypothetical protein [Gammaproteobacteria bacterium]
MRYAWITLLVILLDQGTKWLLPSLGISGIWQTGIGELALEIIKSSPAPEKSIQTTAANNTSLILLAGLLGIYLFVTRWSSQFHFISDKAAIGLQLTGGGLTSQLIDLLFRGSSPNSLRIHAGETFSLNTGFSELALMAGLFLLLVSLFRGSAKIQGELKLSPAKLTPLNFNILPRGIDNIHIDVQLSPRLQKNIKHLIHSLIPLLIQQLQQGRRQLSLPQKQLAVVRKEFHELMNIALHRAKVSGEKQLPDLLFIATLKFIHGEVNNAVAATLQKSKEEKGGSDIRGLKPKANDRFVTWLFRHRDHIIALGNTALTDAICGAQKIALQKGVKTYLGRDTLFSLEAIDSPLVLSESPSNERVQLENYLLLGQQQSDENSFVNIDRQLAEIFSDCLSLVEESEDNRKKESDYLQRNENINSDTIYTLSQPSVLMNPENIAIFLDTDWSRKKLQRTRALRELKTYRKLRQHHRFQHRLREKLKYSLKKSGLAAWVIAAYETRKLIKNSNSDVSASQLASLLARKLNKQEFHQKLAEAFRGASNPPPENFVTESWKKIHKSQERLLDKYLLRFVKDFADYRRDLLTLLVYQRAAAEITLLVDDKDIETSRANFSLYSFLHHSEEETANAPVLSHIIIKADLRRSTEITEKLIEMELNPATHFDRNFFSPINAVIESYGAEKVFIEGDAIILILNDRAGMNQERLIAARACGLSAKIMQIVAKQNRELAAYGLPELELGIGIAYHQAPPRYLFDNKHRITISPAINRADRLSACNWSIRNWRKMHNTNSEFVEVYFPSDNAKGHGEKAQKDMVFNLNGILIDESVFKRITKELTPKTLHNPLDEIGESTLYAFQFPDMTGTTHSLVIRKAPLHFFDPVYPVSECAPVEGRFFYEVLHNYSVLEQLREKH